MVSMDETSRVAIVYMAAGLSSRFGGKIKQLAQVGKNGESLIEISMQQAIRAGVTEIILIVGEKTETAFKDKFGAGYNNTPIYYALQTFDASGRDRPWGTVDAIVSAQGVITSPFILCNGDDLYGEEAIKQARDFLIKSTKEKECAVVGYELGKVLPKNGKTNRGIFKVDKKGFVNKIEEVFEIEKNKLSEKNLSEKDLCSMNLFALKEETIALLKKNLISFQKKHKGDRRAECLLPVELGNLIQKKKIQMTLLKSKGTWIGVTNPEDEEIVRQTLARQ